MDALTKKVEEILKEIKILSKQSGRKPVFQDFEFVSKHTEMKEQLVFPIEVGDTGGEIGFKALYTYFSIPNVSKANNNFRFKIINDWYTIQFEAGAYEVKHINTAIQNYIKSNLVYSNSISRDPNADVPEFSIRADDSTGKAIIEIPANCSVDFTAPFSIGSLLGFDEKILEAGIHYSDKLVDLMPVNTVSICVRINNEDVFGSVTNGDSSNKIYTFYPIVEPGEKINETSKHMVYYSIPNVKKIENITVSLMDQNGQLVDNRNETITIILTLKYFN